MAKCRKLRHRVLVCVHKGLVFSGNHILTDDAGLYGVEAGEQAGGFGGVELGKPLEAALEVGKGGGGFEGGVAAEVMDLGLETVIGGAVEVQVSGMARSG